MCPQLSKTILVRKQDSIVSDMVRDYCKKAKANLVVVSLEEEGIPYVL